MTAAKTSPAKQSQGGGFGAIFPYIIIPVLFVVAILVYKYVFGAPNNFAGGDITSALCTRAVLWYQFF